MLKEQSYQRLFVCFLKQIILDNQDGLVKIINGRFHFQRTIQVLKE